MQVVVYVGGIIVLIIFGFMLTNKISSVNISHTSVQKRMGALVILGFIGVLGFMIYNTPWIQLANSEPADTTRSIGNLLMIDYLLPFELASVLLLIAMVGAIVLARRDLIPEIYDSEGISTALELPERLTEEKLQELSSSKSLDL